MRKFTIVEAFILPIIIFSFAYTWTRPVYLDLQFMPTVINGSITATGLMVGFTGTLILMGLSNSVFKLKKNSVRITVTIAALAFSLGLIWVAYLSLVSVNFHLALKTVIASYMLSGSTLLDFILFLVSCWWKKMT
jgi:hypothetical protein